MGYSPSPCPVSSQDVAASQSGKSASSFAKSPRVDPSLPVSPRASSPVVAASTPIVATDGLPTVAPRGRSPSRRVGAVPAPTRRDRSRSPQRRHLASDRRDRSEEQDSRSSDYSRLSRHTGDVGFELRVGSSLRDLRSPPRDRGLPSDASTRFRPFELDHGDSSDRDRRDRFRPSSWVYSPDRRHPSDRFHLADRVFPPDRCFGVTEATRLTSIFRRMATRPTGTFQPTT